MLLDTMVPVLTEYYVFMLVISVVFHLNRTICPDMCRQHKQFIINFSKQEVPLTVEMGSDPTRAYF